MARAFFNFDQYEVGAVASVAADDFTVQLLEAGWAAEIVELSPGNKALRIQRNSGSSGPNIVTAPDFTVASNQDIEIYCEFTLTTTWASNYFAGGCLAAADNRVYAIRYSSDPGFDAFRLGLVNAAGSNSTSLGGYVEKTNPDAGVVIAMRIGRYNSSDVPVVRGKLWLRDSEPEPDWMWDAANNMLGALAPALYVMNAGDAPIHILGFGIGTIGDSAPTAPIGSIPTIIDAGDELYTPGETGINIVGTNFGSTQGAVYISPTDNVNDVNRVAQTITGWSDTSAVVTIVAGALPRDTNLYLFVVNSNGVANANGFIVQIASTGPNVTDVDGDEKLTDGQAGVVVTGSMFGATQGTGKVLICPTNNVGDVNGVEQTVTAWGDTQITFTAVRGDLDWLTQLFLFVVADDGQSNPQGFNVQFVPRVFVNDSLKLLNGNDSPLSGNEVLLVWRHEPSAAAPNPDQAITLPASATGTIAQEIDRGELAPGDPVYLALFDPDAPFRASAKRVVPTYQ